MLPCTLSVIDERERPDWLPTVPGGGLAPAIFAIAQTEVFMKSVPFRRPGRIAPRLLAFVGCLTLVTPSFRAQQTTDTPGTASTAHYKLAPAFDTSAMDPKTDPCQDFYKFACGNYAARNPIPADQTEVDQFYTLYNVNSERLQGILNRFSAASASRTPNEQKIGDDYAACVNTQLIEQKGLAPVEELLDDISRVSKPGLPYFAGELQRYGVTAFFGFGEMQDFKDSSKQIAVAIQGGIGLPERDYYTRTGEKDKQLRQQYVEHVAKMLTLAGEPAS